MVKKAWIVLTTLILTTSLSYGQGVGVKWYSLEEALELNKKEQKKIFVDVYTDWCGWCKKMDAATFNNPAIATILNTEYYAVKFNAESKDTILFGGRSFVNEGPNGRSPHQLAIALLQGRMSYPSVVYLNEESQLLTAVPGYMTAEGIEPILMFFADDAYKSQSFEDFTKQFVSKVKTQ
ncbi:MAG: thioredoxin family protein [Bacteroidales bacterium]